MTHAKGKQTAKDRRINTVKMYIPLGCENAVSMKYLSQMTGMSEREVRSAVNEARLQGHMIVGDDHGYYFADNVGELVGYYFRLRKHAKTTRSVLRKVKQSLKNRGIDPDDKRGWIYD